MDTDKPMAGALRAAAAMNGHNAVPRDKEAHQCVVCNHDAAIIARESGLTELVQAVEASALDEENTPLGKVTIDAEDWERIVAAARRVREG